VEVTKSEPRWRGRGRGRGGPGGFSPGHSGSGRRRARHRSVRGLLAIPRFCSSTAGAWQSYLGLGGRHRSQEEAIKILGRSLVIDPKVPENPSLSLAPIHLENGRPGHARAMWSVASRARPDYLAAWRPGRPGRSEDRRRARSPMRAWWIGSRGSGCANGPTGEVLAEAGQLVQAQAELNKVLQASSRRPAGARALPWCCLAGRRVPAGGGSRRGVRFAARQRRPRMDWARPNLGVGKRSEAEASLDEGFARPQRPLEVVRRIWRGPRRLKNLSSGKLRWIAPR